jgi:hypothetical protein
MAFNYSDAEIEVSVPSPEGTKRAVVKWPDDQQWIERVRAQKTMVRDLGRRKTVVDVDDFSAHDKALFEDLKVSGDDMDQYEAQRAIGKLATADVEDGGREGNGFVISVRTISGMTKHSLRVPSQKELMEYSRRSMYVIQHPHGLMEYRFNLQAAGDFYDKLAQKAEGYSGPIPIVHKKAAVDELLSLLRAEQEDEKDPDPNV